MADIKSCEGTAKNMGDVKCKLNVGVSEALKGLKAIQREARHATRVLREFEEAYNKVKPIANDCGVTSNELVFALLHHKGGDPS
ncbi:hypothetical protein [Amphibacillus jilinensis]|uniref:hypothetical protein n=1 Tax=Amphibacillus jilinensis TaxID=1216008 RepID=UPI0002D5A838|nr:hypothetical protein [Amphibacillus jilinensis]